VKLRNRISHTTPPVPRPKVRNKTVSAEDAFSRLRNVAGRMQSNGQRRGAIKNELIDQALNYGLNAGDALTVLDEVWPSPKLKLKNRQKKTKHGSVNGRPAVALKLTKAWKIGDPVPANRWTALSHAVFKSPQVRALSHADKHLFVCLLVQCTGNNSGDLKCSFAYMSKHFGWVSPNTLNESRKRLLKLGLLVQVSEGFKGRAARYALTNCLVPQKGAEQ
jgi:hypothetical protein